MVADGICDHIMHVFICGLHIYLTNKKNQQSAGLIASISAQYSADCYCLSSSH